jgi:hypothetical protein
MAKQRVQGFPGEEQNITPGGYAIIRDLTDKVPWKSPLLSLHNPAASNTKPTREFPRLCRGILT